MKGISLAGNAGGALSPPFYFPLRRGAGPETRLVHDIGVPSRKTWISSKPHRPSICWQPRTELACSVYSADMSSEANLDVSSGNNVKELDSLERLISRHQTGGDDPGMISEDAASILANLDADVLRQVRPQIWTAIADLSLQGAADLSPGAVVGLAKAFAVAEAEAPTQLLSALAKRVVTKPRKFTPVQLSCITWAFASLKEQSSDLFFTVLVQLEGQPQAFGPQGFADAIWALGVSGWLTADLLRKLRPALTELVPVMTKNDCQKVLDGVQAVPGGLDAVGLGSNT